MIITYCDKFYPYFFFLRDCSQQIKPSFTFPPKPNHACFFILPNAALLKFKLIWGKFTKAISDAKAAMKYYEVPKVVHLRFDVNF